MAIKRRNDSRSRYWYSLVFWTIAVFAALSFQCAAAEDVVHQGAPVEVGETLAPSLSNLTNATINGTLAPSSSPTTLDCTTLHYDCFGCIQNGCYWCPTDGLCFNTPEFVDPSPNKALLFPTRLHNCQTRESFTQTNCTRIENFFNDPVYSATNWIFSFVKVEPVWERGYFGKGVRVRVNDEGIEGNHPEFLGRIDLNHSCPNSTTESLDSNHGMTVASLLGAAGNNSDCSVGIAPQVTISSCTLGKMDRDEMLVYDLDSFDISQNSFAYEGCGPLASGKLNCGDDCEWKGRKLRDRCPFSAIPYEGYPYFPCDVCNITNITDSDPDELGDDCLTAIQLHCEWYPKLERGACLEFLDLILYRRDQYSGGECHFGVLNEDTIDAITKGITEGRDGKGIIYVFAAGNEYHLGDDTNFQGLGANTRFTIAVAATGKQAVASYSTPGASVFISAPGGDKKQSVTPIVAASNDGSCEQMGDGTSFAAPVVSGVIALMLEANPDLTWRDVQEILVRTAQVYPGAPGDRSLTRNGAGRIHSNRYGFGIINANRSVAMSENWVNIGPERSLVREGKGSKVIIDDRKNVTKMSLYVDSGDIEFVTETVYLYVKVKHSSRGHLRVDLRSPSNTLSVMSPGERPEDQQKRWMKFTSVRYWGEDPNGQWNIRIIDTVPGTASDCIDYDDYRFQYFNEDEDQDLEISCDSRHAREMSQFCSKGALNPTGLNRSCYEFGLDSACERMERFETTSVNNRTAFEACCACGGGFSPETLPETVVEWKIVVYGRKKSTMEGWFSGVGNDVKLGRWGERGVVREGERFRKPEGVEAITGAREMFGGGVRGRNRRD